MIRNIGVLQTTVAEIVTVREHQRRWMLSCADGTLTFSSPCLLHHAFRLVFRVRHGIRCGPAMTTDVFQLDFRPCAWRSAGTTISELSQPLSRRRSFQPISFSPPEFGLRGNSGDGGGNWNPLSGRNA